NSRKNLRCTDPYCLRQGHFFHVHRAWPCEESVNDPHHDSADEKGEGHHPEIFQVFADLFRKCPRWNCCYNKRYQGKTERICQNGAIAARASRERANKLQDAPPRELCRFVTSQLF